MNEATESLMDDSWAGLIVPIHVCVSRGCVVWPRYVYSVREMSVCRHPIQIKNQWYDFMPRDWYDSNCCGNGCRMTAQDKTPTYSSIYGDSRYVRAYASVRIDYGKTVTIFGVDNNNQTLKHKNLDGSWSEGAIITLAGPYGTTLSFVRRIDRVLLDDMQGEVRLYAYDTVNAVLEDLAVYQPGETNPEYVRYHLNVPCETNSINALVKLRFIPVRFDTDLVMIPLRPLKTMCQSVKFGEAGDISNKIAFEKEAIRQMNQIKRNELPDSQIPVNCGAFGGHIVHQAVW